MLMSAGIAQEKILAFLNFCLEPEQECSISKFATKFSQTLGDKILNNWT